MKKMILIIFIALAEYGYSQDYMPFPKDSSEWFVKSEYFDGEGGPSSFGKERFFVEGDTIVNDTLYIELFSESYHTIRSLGFLYQDSTYQKLYFNYNEGNFNADYGMNNLLIMDLGLEVGQSSQFYRFEDIIVTEVDSVNVNGKFRKRITFNALIMCGGVSELLCFVEGVGSNAGLLPVDYLGLIASSLTCFQVKGESVYPLTLDENACDLYTNIESKKTNSDYEDFLVYPNPFYEDLIIESNSFNEDISKIRLVNSFGQVVFDKVITKSEKIELELSSLPRGLYLMRIEKNKSEIFSKAIVKN